MPPTPRGLTLCTFQKGVFHSTLLFTCPPPLCSGQEWAEGVRRQNNCSPPLPEPEPPLSDGGRFHGGPAPDESSHLVCDADQTSRLQNVICSPAPDAFNPCEDIMGYKTLRWGRELSRCSGRGRELSRRSGGAGNIPG